jgi:hypothetical protein
MYMLWDRLWGTSPQLARLNEAIEDMRSELADTGHDNSAAWYEAAVTHVERASTLARTRQVDAAWDHLYRARECHVMGMSADAVIFAARELNAEVEHSGKFSEWRARQFRNCCDRLFQKGRAREKG